jgi:hypothetical protein
VTFEINRSNNEIHNGSVDIYSPPKKIQLDKSTEEAMITDKVCFSDTMFYQFSGFPYVIMSIPLNKENTQKSSVLVVEVDLRSFWLKMDSIQINDFNIIITDRNGKILAHNDKKQIGFKVDK